MVKIKIPATSANLGVLFDKGAVALTAYENTISLKKTNTFSMDITGFGENYLPDDKSNLVYRAIEYFYKKIGCKIPEFAISMENGIPPSRGLGSSAACIAGGIFAANEIEGNILNKEEIISMAAKMEGHGDNVCAAVSGGFVIYQENGNIKIEADEIVSFVISMPEKKLSTKRSRSVLPCNYDEKTLEKAMNLEKSMIKALIQKDYAKAGYLMEYDVRHQPFRKKFIPYWDEVKNTAKKSGAWGTALSGAGPSLITICRKDTQKKIIVDLQVSVAKRYNLNIIGCELNPYGIMRI